MYNFRVEYHVVVDSLVVIMLFLSVGLAFACDASRIWTDHLVATLHYIASRSEVYFKLYVHIKTRRKTFAAKEGASSNFALGSLDAVVEF